MKKKWVLVAFGVGVLSLSAAVISAVPKTEEYYLEQNTAVSPLLLSDIRMTDYVSLPIFEGMEIEETTNIEDNAVAKKEAYQELLRMAEKLTAPAANSTIICDVKISRDTAFIDKLEDYSVSTQTSLGKTITEYLSEHPGETNIRMDGTYNGSAATLDINIKGFYNIPYPVSNDYMKKHTQYNSFSEMVRHYIKSKFNESRFSLRTETMSNLIDYSISKTTFMELPESLYDQEFETLKKEDETVQYDTAKKSLKKIFFIATVLDRYSLADEQERERIVSKYEEENSVSLEGYERERMSYLLFEEDVSNYLYKIVDIKENTLDADSAISLE